MQHLARKGTRQSCADAHLLVLSNQRRASIGGYDAYGPFYVERGDTVEMQQSMNHTVVSWQAGVGGVCRKRPHLLAWWEAMTACSLPKEQQRAACTHTKPRGPTLSLRTGFQCNARGRIWRTGSGEQLCKCNHKPASDTQPSPRFVVLGGVSSPEAVRRPALLLSPSADSQQQGCHALVVLGPEALAAEAAAAAACGPLPDDDGCGVWHLVAF